MKNLVEKLLELARELGVDYAQILTTKADKADVTSLETKVDQKATKANTLAGYAIEDAYTRQEADALVDERLAELIGTAPENLDTLHEIAAALIADQESIGALLAQIAKKADKEDLSTTNATVAGISSEMTEKASQSSVNALSELVSSLNQSLAAKASKAALDSLTATVDTNTTAIASKATQASVDAINSALANKVDSSAVYSKTEVASIINNRISAIVGTAPENLDTLQEIAAALANEQDAVAAVTVSLGKKANQVDLVDLTTRVDTLTTSVSSKANKADLDALAGVVAELSSSSSDDMSIYRSDKDEYGVFKTIVQKRQDGTTARVSVLSEGTAPKYTKRTMSFYSADGASIVSTATYTLSYDSDGDIISEVLN